VRKKLLVVIPDGVGLRNFSFTSFASEAQNMSWDVVYLNLTNFSLTSIGLAEIRPTLLGVDRLSDMFKAALIKARLRYFRKKFNDGIYLKYIFKPHVTNLKGFARTSIVEILSNLCSTERGTNWLERTMYALITKGDSFHYFIQQLAEINPDFIFCTNHRPIKALPVMLAAQKLGIKTGVFIFSWDNLPKATMVVKGSVYFVWSAFMKAELLNYYPSLSPKQIFITGTPQFEPHTTKTRVIDKEIFFNRYGLSKEKRYLCFSGDDVTTSPFDQDYLRDVAIAVDKLNQQGFNIGIIFRPCPVDNSKRYDAVQDAYPDIITRIAPVWKQFGDSWDDVMPTPEDIEILISTIAYSEFVINIASSMIFDFELFNKPCIYLNYTITERKNNNWRAQQVYKFVHFRSMPEVGCVFWANSRDDLLMRIKQILTGGSSKTLESAGVWRNRILGPAPEQAANKIISAINKITEH
jgi:hypothetical protein